MLTNIYMIIDTNDFPATSLLTLLIKFLNLGVVLRTGNVRFPDCCTKSDMTNGRVDNNYRSGLLECIRSSKWNLSPSRAFERQQPYQGSDEMTQGLWLSGETKALERGGQRVKEIKLIQMQLLIHEYKKVCIRSVKSNFDHMTWQ